MNDNECFYGIALDELEERFINAMLESFAKWRENGNSNIIIPHLLEHFNILDDFWDRLSKGTSDPNRHLAVPDFMAMLQQLRDELERTDFKHFLKQKQTRSGEKKNIGRKKTK